MTLYSDLKQLTDSGNLPCSILVSANNVNRAFSEISNFIKNEMGIDLNSYSENSLIIAPEESGNINIDQIRKLKNLLYQTTTEQSKIAVILEADSMNVNCYNACLKILEEPDGRVHIFLISNKISKIIQTVQSRCYKIKCNYLETDSNKMYADLIEVFVKNDIGLLAKLDLKINWQSFAKSCQLMVSRMIKFQLEYNLEEELENEKILFKKIKSNTEELLVCYDEVSLLALKLDQYGLEPKSVAILIFNYIYEHFSN
jgi:DNA polymerase III delta prime subunit